VKDEDLDFGLRSRRYDVVEEGTTAKRNAIACKIGKNDNISFSTEGLRSYCFAPWEPVIFDALLVAAAIEFCDRECRRKAESWGREFDVTLPVHEVTRWRDPDVHSSLVDALEFLTGDRWHLRFKPRKKPEPPPRQGTIPFPANARWVIPFSNGLDSWSVATLTEHQQGSGLLRVRLSPHGARSARRPAKEAFAIVPYNVKAGEHHLNETSVRSRGFKFALISGIAAYLAKVEEVIVPESGQGALGPVLVSVGQAYPDYRCHPQFMVRVEHFLAALLGHKVHYKFPRLWNTKSETLREALSTETSKAWIETRSCWQRQRWASVEGTLRQCGICAACLLRRLSVFSAGQTEPPGQYVWENLNASTFEEGAAASFTRHNKMHRRYARSGTLHLDYIAEMANSAAHASTVTRNAVLLSQALGIPAPDVQARLVSMLGTHAREWSQFVHSLGDQSFIARWAQAAE
jgi:7-cyano-7-deazaguanine synthase in queuosine biosynthesis